MISVIVMNKNLFRHSLIGLLERNLITNKEIEEAGKNLNWKLVNFYI